MVGPTDLFLVSFVYSEQVACPVTSSELKIVVTLILPTSLTFVVAVVSSWRGLVVPGWFVIGAPIRRLVVTR